MRRTKSGGLPRARLSRPERHSARPALEGALSASKGDVRLEAGPSSSRRPAGGILTKRKGGKQEMKHQALFLGIFAAGMVNLPAFAADGGSGITGVRWGKNAFNFEPMPSGPQPLRNLMRRPDGTGNAGQLVGDY